MTSNAHTAAQFRHMHVDIADLILWIPVAVAVAATAFTAFVSSPRRDEHPPYANSRALTGCLIATAGACLLLAVSRRVLRKHEDPHQAAVTIIFLVLFAAAVLIVRYRKINAVPVLATWTAAFFFAVMHLVSVPFGAGWNHPFSVSDVLQGIAILIFLLFLFGQMPLWRSLDAGACIFFGGVGLIVVLLGITVTCAAAGDLIAPVTVTDPSQRPSVQEPFYRGLHGYAAGFHIGHMVSSVTWIAFGAWLLLRRPGQSGDYTTSRVAGLVVAVVAVGKLVHIDMTLLGGAWRAAAFILFSLLITAAAILGARRNTPRPGPGGAPAPMRAKGSR